MFNLNDYISSIPLDTINLITLTYYSSKSEIMNIYDTNFKFDENIIPLVTSVLETTPNIIKAKRYININSESIIMIGNQNEIPNKSNLSFPCFFSDLQQKNLNIQNIQGYSKKIVNTLDIEFKGKENCIEEDEILGLNVNKGLIRMYKLDNMKCEFTHNILNEEELTIIVWSWEYANFEIVINKKYPKLCQLHFNIYITEDNKIITSKLDNINQIVDKLDKIKNEMVSRTNTYFE